MPPNRRRVLQLARVTSYRNFLLAYYLFKMSFLKTLSLIRDKSLNVSEKIFSLARYYTDKYFWRQLNRGAAAEIFLTFLVKPLSSLLLTKSFYFIEPYFSFAKPKRKVCKRKGLSTRFFCITQKARAAVVHDGRVIAHFH